MEENQTVPAMIPEGDFAAFLEGEKVETLLSPLGYAYCAEGQDADLRVKRLERLEVTARRRGATPAQMEDWRMLRDRELDIEWMLNRDSVRSKARWVALQGSPLQTIADVEPRVAEYLCEPYLPRGMITILAGVAFGGETGFLVGAMTMLVSNMLFSQGPWTPWQMFAMGIIGWLAGVLYRKGVLRRGRLSLCIFGVIASTIIYGGIMNPASALMWSNTINWKIILSYYVTGLPVDLVRAIATFFFLWLIAEPMLEKLDRVKVKYGLAE